MNQPFNQTLLMSGAQYMSNAAPINALMHANEPFNTSLAIEQHSAIKKALEDQGVNVIQVEPPAGCQDGIFTANWALIRVDKAIMSSLPTVRKPEEAYARKVLEALGKEIILVPDGLKFSGQGDALPCGDYVFMGTGYRTDPEVHQFVAEQLGFQVISVQAVPEVDTAGNPVINASTGWPDSKFYDLDLAISILKIPTKSEKGLIAWCPEALVPESQELIRSLDFVDKIEVPLSEAINVSACNLVSTGQYVIMNAGAPLLQAAIEAHGLTVTTLHNEELAKNGGSVRCSTLALDNV